jgi:hypothetical protein
MRRSRIVRLAVAVTGTLSIWLASNSAADASQPRRHRQQVRASRHVCDMRVSPRRAVTRAGRLSAASRRLIRRHTFALLQRTRAKPLTEDDAAIQTGAAVGGYDDPGLLAVFVPIGVLTATQCPLLSHRPVSRRSPRGPPTVST